MYKNPLLNLYDTTSPVPFRDRKTIQNYRALKLPNVEKAVNETALVMSHTQLLGTRGYMTQWVQAIAKVNARLGQVKALCRKQADGK